MRRLLPLAALAVLAGCIDVPEDDTFRSSSASASDASCADGALGVFSWAFPDEGGMGLGVTDDFDVPRGTRELAIEYTPPLAYVRSYRVVVSDPRAEPVFWREYGEGAGAGTSTVSAGTQTSGEDLGYPVRAGSYTFELATEGTMRGMSIAVTAVGCY